MSKFRTFLERKNVRPSAKLYFVDAMSTMALGLFASLLIGTIFKTLGQYTHLQIFTDIAGYATKATGAALGVARMVEIPWAYRLWMMSASQSK